MLSSSGGSSSGSSSGVSSSSGSTNTIVRVPVVIVVDRFPPRTHARSVQGEVQKSMFALVYGAGAPGNNTFKRGDALTAGGYPIRQYGEETEATSDSSRPRLGEGSPRRALADL